MHALRNHTPCDFTAGMCEITVSRENTPLGAISQGAVISQAPRVISHPPVISQALRNHTPCDFAAGTCEITASRENTPLGAISHRL